MAKCNICFDYSIKDPIFTPFIHGFCQECIIKWIIEKRHMLIIPCPVCKYDISELAGARDRSTLFTEEPINEEMFDDDVELNQPILLRTHTDLNTVPAHLAPTVNINGQIMEVENVISATPTYNSTNNLLAQLQRTSLAHSAFINRSFPIQSISASNMSNNPPVMPPYIDFNRASEINALRRDLEDTTNTLQNSLQNINSAELNTIDTRYQPNERFVMMSATPINNRPHTIDEIMSLLLPTNTLQNDEPRHILDKVIDLGKSRK